jgi:hypothetical protein
MELEGSPKQIRNPNARTFKLEKAKMESENDSEMGDLVLEGKRGWRFHLSYTASFISLIGGIYFFGFFWPNSPVRNKQNTTEALVAILAVIFCSSLVPVLLYNIWMSFRVYEKGVQFNKKTILFSEIKFFMYKAGGYRRPSTLKFVMEDLLRKPIYVPLSLWGNEEEILESVRKEVGPKEVDFSYWTR